MAVEGGISGWPQTKFTTFLVLLLLWLVEASMGFAFLLGSINVPVLLE